MKKFFVIVLFAALSAISSYAQDEIQGFVPMTYKHGHLYMDGDKLKGKDIKAIYPEGRAQYISGRTMRISGITVTSVGAIGTAYGVALFIDGRISANKPNTDDTQENISNGLGGAFAQLFGIVISAGGALVTAGGVALWTGGNATIKSTGKKYNKKYGEDYAPTLSFGATNNGVGLALNF